MAADPKSTCSFVSIIDVRSPDTIRFIAQRNSPTKPATSTSTSSSAFAPIPGDRRDGRSHADTGRGQLMTVLGEFLLPMGGSAWTQTLVAALELRGLSGKAARQVHSRTEARGWISRERIGRQTRWSLTEAAEDVLTPGAERLYNFGRRTRTWDQNWLLVFVSVPETDRAARYRMARALNWAGFGTFRQGVWLSPWTEIETVAVTVLGELGIEGRTFQAEVGQLGTGEDLANHAWNLTELRAEYENFLSHTAKITPASPAHDAAALTGMVHLWRQFPLHDPDLPSELLAQDWPGRTAAERFEQLRSELLPGARRWWTEQEASHSR